MANIDLRYLIANFYAGLNIIHYHIYNKSVLIPMVDNKYCK